MKCPIPSHLAPAVVIISVALSVSRLLGAPAQTQPAPESKSPATPPPAWVGIENFSGHAITQVRIETHEGKVILAAARCPQGVSVPAKIAAFDPSQWLRVTFIGMDQHRHTADFTKPVGMSGDRPDLIYTVFIGHDDQPVIRTSLRGEPKVLGDWHVADDRLGHVNPQAMSQPQLLGIGPRDPYFDSAQALVRYPIYDELRLSRAGDFFGGGATSETYNGVTRTVPAGDLIEISAVGTDSITFIGPKGPVVVKFSPDAGPAALKAGGKVPQGPPVTQPSGESPGRSLLGWIAEQMYRGEKMQSIGVSNWASKKVTDLKMSARGRSYAWPAEIRPGGGESSMGEVTEVALTGDVHVTYTDGNGKPRTADFHNVATEKGTQYPKREFYFDARYDVLLRTYDLTDNGLRAERWCVPIADGKPDKPIPLPQLLGTTPNTAITNQWDAIIRFPRNDRIDTYRNGEMLGGDKHDYTSHQTKLGIGRYRIESILADHMILIADGKRITAPLEAGAKTPATPLPKAGENHQ
ncbi:MAG TPA: hypothetical protein VFC78_18110 [Tepidisphaeraceae bacterium]|nr:hypothetical protein [Tepidisphaeraceae bacterium]